MIWNRVMCIAYTLRRNVKPNHQIPKEAICLQPKQLLNTPHIEGPYLRDEITRVVTAAQTAKLDWFHAVYELLEKHEIHKDWRAQFYTHAQGVADARLDHSTT